MSVKKALLNLLRQICHIAAWVTYHLVTLYDKTHAAYAIFRNRARETLETNHRFSYPPVRLHRYWHTTRLLRLAPGAGVEPLEGILLTNVTIKIFSFAWTFGELHYHAISYCWGDSTLTKMVHLNGKLLPITETLHSALQSQRQQEIPVILWADQICIDQSPAALDERSQQVQRMGEIYANADSVTIWLGKPPRFSDEIFRRLNMLDDLHHPNQADEADGQTAQTYLEDDTESRVSGMSEATCGTPALDEEDQDKEQLMVGLQDLVNNPWFRRIWVLQEAALAKNLFVQAGSWQVTWKRFVISVGRLQDTTKRPTENVRLVYDVEMLREQRFSDKLDDFDLLTMAEAFRGRQATDIRDKIYGLLGLVTPASSKLAFRADYSKSPEQVFIEFVRWHIKVHGNVRVLARCCSEEVCERLAIEHKQPRLPPWSPDWSVTSSSNCGHIVDDYFASKTSEQLYKTSRSFRADARVVFEQNEPSLSRTSNAVLVLTGVIVDTVTQVVDRIHTWEEDLDLLSDTWMEWRRLAVQEGTADPYKGRAGNIDAFWRTLVVDRTNPLERASPHLGLNSGSLLGMEDLNVDPVGKFAGARSGVSEWREAESDGGEDLNGKVLACLQKWNAVHLRKRIFRSERGYLGISCEHVRKGDRVAILWGGRLPFLLREHGNVLLAGVRGQPSLTDDTVVPTYRLVGGECYIHGLADGEGLDLAERVGILPTKICLA